MGPELIGGIGLGLFLLSAMLGLPIWISFILIGVVGYTVVSGQGGLSVAGLAVLDNIRNYSFAVLPVFLLMGEFADISGMMKDAYQSMSVLLGRIRGGLAMASVVGAAAFSLVSGSSMACSAIMTRIALPQLMEHKYDPKLATGALAAGGTLGNLIPPGLVLVVYAIVAEVSLGKLFIASYVPGFLLTFMYMIQIYIQCKVNPTMGPVTGISTTWKEKLFAGKGLVALIVVFGLTLGGIQFGVFTPNEAASIATVIVFFYALAKRALRGRNLFRAFRNTFATTGMALAILIGASVFNVFVAMSELPQRLADGLLALNLSATGLIIVIMVVYFILGIPLNGTAVILLTLPILLPVLNAYNIDLVWFGVLTIVQSELANITPPIGMNLFVVAAMAKPKGIQIDTVFKGSMPFVVTCVGFLVLLIAFPSISMWLVSQMK